MKKILLLSLFTAFLFQVRVFSQALNNRHDPKVDINLSPIFQQYDKS